MEDREQWFTLLAQKDWEAIGKIIYQKKKAKVQDPFLTQMTGFFESEFFTFAELCNCIHLTTRLHST